MSSSTSKVVMDLGLINERFAVGRKLGSGSFGEIYIAYDRLRGIDVAVKVESMHTKHPQIMYEAKIYRALTGGKGIPLLHWYGTAGNYNVLVMELLGPSLEDLFCHMRRKFNLKTVLMVADQMLDRLELLHSKHYIHRDIKPDNFVVKGDMVYLIDFGLAKRFRDPKTMEHIPMKTGKNLTGTARYVSISTHMGVEPSRRDDLESLCYVWLYFLRGSLPWQGQRGSKRTKYAKIMGLKIDTQPEELVDVVPNLKKKFAGPSRSSFGEYDSNSSTAASEHENYWIVTQQVFPHQLPQEFKFYLQYCRNLRFDETPDYVYLRRLLKDVFYREGFSYDRVFDWGVAPPKKFTYSPTRQVAPPHPEKH